MPIGVSRVFSANPITTVLSVSPVPDDQGSHYLMKILVGIQKLD